MYTGTLHWVCPNSKLFKIINYFPGKSWCINNLRALSHKGCKINISPHRQWYKIIHRTLQYENEDYLRKPFFSFKTIATRLLIVSQWQDKPFALTSPLRVEPIKVTMGDWHDERTEPNGWRGFPYPINTHLTWKISFLAESGEKD